MFTEREPREYHGAIVDLTDRCNLRCRHCFYYRNERDRLLEEITRMRGKYPGEARKRGQPAMADGMLPGAS